MENENTKKSYDYEIYRPKLPEGWDVLEQLTNGKNSYISFYRWGKIHHNGESQRIFICFHEFSPYTNPGITYKYTIRGGRHIIPEQKIRRFDNLKDATTYLVYLMESTDRWINEINSQSYIDSYNRKISKLVAEAV